MGGETHTCTGESSEDAEFNRARINDASSVVAEISQFKILLVVSMWCTTSILGAELERDPGLVHCLR